jgi:hypothetical protein
MRRAMRHGNVACQGVTPAGRDVAVEPNPFNVPIVRKKHTFGQYYRARIDAPRTQIPLNFN